MAMPDTGLPEGTDTILDDAADTTARDGATTGAPAAREDEARSKFTELKQSALDGTADLRAQASDKAWGFADQGKARAGDALQNFAKMVGDAAAQVDEKVGPQYGDYARRAADMVSGAAENLQNKSVEDLVEDAKSVVRNSPVVAIGIAAALGFVVARLARSSTPTGADEAA